MGAADRRGGPPRRAYEGVAFLGFRLFGGLFGTFGAFVSKQRYTRVVFVGKELAPPS